MPERSALTQGVQVGVEVTPGTAVAANKKFNSIGFELSPTPAFGTYRPIGQKFMGTAWLNQDWSSIAMSGVPNYNELAYVFSSCINYAAPVQQGGTTAYLWTFTPASGAEDTVKTYTIEAGGSVRAHRTAYSIISDVEIALSRTDTSLSGGGFAMGVEDGVTLTGSPTGVTERIVQPLHWNVYSDTTSGGLGTTQLLRVISATWRLGNRHGPVWAVNRSQNSYVAHVEQEPTAELEILMEADAAGMAFFTDAKAGTTKYIRLQAQDAANSAGTGFPYSLTIDGAYKITDVGGFSDEDGIFAVSFTASAVHDPAWGTGKALTVALINKLTSL